MESIKSRKKKRESRAQTGNEARSETEGEQGVSAGPYPISAGTTRSDSWVDAVVTLLATIVFGLGWAVVELEGAEPARAGYDQAAWSSNAIEAAIGADANPSAIGEPWGAERKRWADYTATVMAPRNSKQ